MTDQTSRKARGLLGEAISRVAVQPPIKQPGTTTGLTVEPPRYEKQIKSLADLNRANAIFSEQHIKTFEWAIARWPSRLTDALRKFETSVRVRGLKRARTLEWHLSASRRRDNGRCGISKRRKYGPARDQLKMLHAEWCADPKSNRNAAEFAGKAERRINRLCTAKVTKSTVVSWLKELNLRSPRSRQKVSRQVALLRHQ